QAERAAFLRADDIERAQVGRGSAAPIVQTVAELPGARFGTVEVVEAIKRIASTDERLSAQRAVGGAGDEQVGEAYSQPLHVVAIARPGDLPCPVENSVTVELHDVAIPEPGRHLAL